MSYLTIVNPSEPCGTLPQNLAMDFKFPLDPFQQHAIAAISRDENVLVTAKTGSGKTLVGEYQIAHSLAKGGRVFYTTPIKSLSNQKFHDLKAMFPSVGIMTGDLKYCPDAQVVIMTTEILRNLLFKKDSSTRELGPMADLSVDGLDAVVFDECHYINDRDRGAVWEETMILLPREVNLVLLSATVDAPEVFAGWLGELKRKQIHLISTQYRIVPLLHAVYRQEELVPIMDNREKFYGEAYKAWLRWHEQDAKAGDKHKEKVAERKAGGYEAPTVARGDSIKAYKHQMNELIGKLHEKTLLPALFFVFSRKGCERYADSVEHTLLDSSDTASVRHILHFHLHRYGETVSKLPQYHALTKLLERGIAFHHSGLVPVLKEIVEILFGRGFVKLLFATETFAVGINMPTKTVVFTGYRKYDEVSEGMRMLNTDEYIQMAGRAGRRGKDDKGLVLYLPDRRPEDLESIQRMMQGSRATFQSRMTFHYDFLLKTLQSGNLDWIDLLHKSYWYQRHRLYVEEVQKDIAAEEAVVQSLALTGAEIADMEAYEAITAKLKGAVNAAKKEAQKELGAWQNRRMGPRWAQLQKELWPKWVLGRQRIGRLGAELEAAKDPTEGIWPSLEALGQMGLLRQPVIRGSIGTPGVQASESLELTALGVMATEINEGHPVLMAQLYRSGILELEAPDVIVCCLAAFIAEGKPEQTPVQQLDVPTPVRDALRFIETKAQENQAIEAGLGGRSKQGYWALSTTWIEPVWRWLGGASLQELCQDYDTYEGNMIRIFMKVANLLEEWRSLATYCEHAEMLEKMRDFEQLILRDVAVCSSLYISM
jgi:superfamily II RNA helicase